MSTVTQLVSDDMIERARVAAWRVSCGGTRAATNVSVAEVIAMATILCLLDQGYGEEGDHDDP